MSKFSFQNLVESLLFEAVPETAPDWYKDVFNHFKKYTNTNDDPTKLPDPGSDLFNIISVGISSGSINTGVIPLTYIPIVDLFRLLKNASGGAGNNVNSFIKAVNKTDKVKNVIDNFLKTDIVNYKPQDKDVVQYARKMNDAIDIAAKAALSTYNNKSIVDAVNEMVKKRTNAWTRISALRNPWGSPFQNFIREILLNPQQYAGGTKKIPGDFTQIVDSLYVQSLIRIGVTAQEYYKSKNDGNFDARGYEDLLYNKNNNYSIQNITDDESAEGIQLIQALGAVAEYQRSTVGAKQRLSYASQAASSFTSAFGAKTYVGS